MVVRSMHRAGVEERVVDRSFGRLLLDRVHVSSGPSVSGRLLARANRPLTAMKWHRVPNTSAYRDLLTRDGGH